MGSLQEAVLQYVEGELRKDPRVKNVALFAGAREIDASVGELTMQQFHGKYRLPATRRIAPPPRPARRPKPVPAPAPAASPAASGDGDAVREFVEATLAANPGITNADLFAGAKEIDPAIAELSPRQFHAKYPLQVKARLARATAPKRRTPRKPKAPAAATTAAPAAPSAASGDPRAVRRLLLDLAKELANAESQADTIEVMVRLDDYVADIVKSARG